LRTPAGDSRPFESDVPAHSCRISDEPNLSGYQQDAQSLCKVGRAGEVFLFLFSKSSLTSQLRPELKLYVCQNNIYVTKITLVSQIARMLSLPPANVTALL
jgi:hypothetical protein